MGSLNVSLNSAQKVVGSESGITLDPYFFRDSSTCLSVSPLKCMIVTPIRCGKGGLRTADPSRGSNFQYLFLGPPLTYSAGPAPPGRDPWWPGRWR